MVVFVRKGHPPNFNMLVVVVLVAMSLSTFHQPIHFSHCSPLALGSAVGGIQINATVLKLSEAKIDNFDNNWP